MKTLILSCFLLLNLGVFAQDSHGVHGKITDDHAAPVGFATLTLLNYGDSTPLATVLSDKNGLYAFPSRTGDHFLLKVSSVGFAPGFREITLGQGAGDQWDVSLSPAARELSGIVISASRPLIEPQVDRLVLHVSNSILSGGYNALEVVGKAPGVYVDPRSDNISLNGKGDVTILIDGKKTYLSSADLATYLKGMQSSDIDKVEVIANPGAKYDAEGTGGIINIITKRSARNGTTGSATASGSVVNGGRGRGSAGISLSHKHNDLVVYGGYNFSERGSLATDAARIDYLDPGGKTALGSHIIGSDISNNTVSQSYRAGLDWTASHLTSISLVAKGSQSHTLGNQFSQTDIIQQAGTTDSTLFNTTDKDRKSWQYSADLNLTQAFDAAKTKVLTADVSVSTFSSREGNNILNQYVIGGVQSEGLSLRNALPTDIRIGVGSLDYTQPLWKGKWEVGIKASRVYTDNNAAYEILDGQKWVNDSTRTNHFTYLEQVNAAYTDFGSTVLGWDYKVGVRAEQTISTGDLITTGEKNDGRYIDLFPSLSLHKKIGASQDLSIAYSRRINRPSYQDLNPFIYFVDIYTYVQGNPFLSAEYSNNVDLTYLIKDKYVISAGYSSTDHVISYVTQLTNPDSDIVRTRSENLNSLQQCYLNFSVPVDIARWWALQAEIDGTYLKYGVSDIPGAVSSSGAYATIDVSNYFTLPHGWKPELDVYYYTPHPDGVSQVKASYNVSSGLQKSFFSGKLRLRASYNDIFRSARYSSTSAVAGLRMQDVYHWDSNFFMLSLTYNFGSNRYNSSAQHNNIASDEQNRIK